MHPSLTTQLLYRQVQNRLLSVSISPQQAEAEASWILEKVFGVANTQIHLGDPLSLTDSQQAMLQDLLFQRTEKRVPLQYLLHEAHFYGLKWYVNPHVLIPRPETEQLVEAALQIIKPGMRILDIGTGSGIIAITIATKRAQKVDVVATDASPQALAVARINQKLHKTQVEFLKAGDLFEPVGEQQFDVILSNPPYIDPALKHTLAPEVLHQEPATALFPPQEINDPFYFYQRLTKEGKRHLKPNGYLMVECGAGMGPGIQQLFLSQGFKQIQIKRDYAKQDRIVIGHWPG